MARFYTHRVKAMLTDLVGDLGISVAFSDHNSAISLGDYKSAMENAAQSAGVRMDWRDTELGSEVVFSPKS